MFPHHETEIKLLFWETSSLMIIHNNMENLADTGFIIIIWLKFFLEQVCILNRIEMNKFMVPMTFEAITSFSMDGDSTSEGWLNKQITFYN